MMNMSRCRLLSAALVGATLPHAAFAGTPKEITWDDLTPPDVPYCEILGEGEKDRRNNTWRPIFDANATKLNPVLDGAYGILPGFIIPIGLSIDGVTNFVLVPYVGACIHTPPPPPNQLVFVTPQRPWPGDDLRETVWVTGQMRHESQQTNMAETGYVLKAEKMEFDLW